jgi:transposase
MTDVNSPLILATGERTVAELRLARLPRAADRRAHSARETDHRDLANLNTHQATGMRVFVDAHDWLAVYQLPSYCPGLNPVEGIWSLLRRKLASTAFTDPDHLIDAVRRGLPRSSIGRS